ncbi:hypothetical protein [Enorma phocaeensis]|uniref:hypothetical protein n=1 Tax=Enorma phocaeensis TaxID=1871019 RepID=UPI000C814CA1|nr:hypothetical protein [Enorma phocaeensis]
MENAQDKRPLIAIGIVVALVACLFIPYSHWDTDIVSGRLVSEGTIVERNDDAIAVRLYTMTASNNMIETNTFLVLQGYIPDDAYTGQRVRIGYSSSDGLYANPDQTVQVSYYVDGNVLTGMILDWLIPFQSAKTDLRIVDIQSDGSLLAYNMAS